MEETFTKVFGPSTIKIADGVVTVRVPEFMESYSESRGYEKRDESWDMTLPTEFVAVASEAKASNKSLQITYGNLGFADGADVLDVQMIEP